MHCGHAMFRGCVAWRRNCKPCRTKRQGQIDGHPVGCFISIKMSKTSKCFVLITVSYERRPQFSVKTLVYVLFLGSIEDSVHAYVQNKQCSQRKIVGV